MLYEDRWIRCDATTLEIRGYYFPFLRSKVIAYRDIRGVTPIRLGHLSGRWRIWGSSNPRQWWHLDWSRPHKDIALALELGTAVQPVITPDDPAQVASIIEARRQPSK